MKSAVMQSGATWCSAPYGPRLQHGGDGDDDGGHVLNQPTQLFCVSDIYLFICFMSW